MRMNEVKKIILKSALISLGINVTGLIINIITFHLLGKVFLAMPLYGGEWNGYVGFGIMMNETFPMTTSGEIVRSNKWLSIKPMNFIFTFIIFFFITMIIVKLNQNMKNVNAKPNLQ